jgi:hypothetical protein
MFTNRDKLDKIGNKELAKKIKSLRAIPGFEYIDWESWLQSEEPDYPYIGQMCQFKPYEETFAICDWISGVLVDKQIIAGKEYKLIIAQGTMYKIPSNRVRFLGD